MENNKIIERIHDVITSGKILSSDYKVNDAKHQIWLKRCEDAIMQIKPDGQNLVSRFYNVQPSPLMVKFGGQAGVSVLKIQNIINGRLDFLINLIVLIQERDHYGNESDLISDTKTRIYNNEKVFIVHGRDDSKKLEVEKLIYKIGLTPIILSDQSNKGQTIIEKFENHTEQVDFAVILLTGDDEGALNRKYSEKGDTRLQPRARQNVIFELGYFTALLGRERVCVLFESGVEIPSDYQGVGWHLYDNNKGWQNSLIKEMKAVGFKFDANRLYD